MPGTPGILLYPLPWRTRHTSIGDRLITSPRLHFSRVCLLTLSLLATPALGAGSEPPGSFQTWLEGVRQEARSRGVDQAILDTALGGLEPIPRVLELDQRQPEFTDTFLNYLDRRVTDARVEEGRKLLRKHGRLLKRASRQYGIPANVLVAFWGLETHYGKFLGPYPVPAALATLAYDNRRADFFRRQLLDALDILQAGNVAPEAMVGSWAGAMGHVQFMPSTYRAYAVDGDGDGRKDLWGSLPDAFSSAANYLNELGWRGGEIWGREVKLPRDFDWSLTGPDVKKNVAAWRALGVTQADGRRLPKLGNITGTILLPQGHAGPAFLVYRNFDAILTWNRSINYALAVGYLSDRLLGLPALRNGRDADNRPIPREEAQAMQEQLIQLGLYTGQADGVLGSRTKAAIRGYQRQAGLPVDGHPSLGLLEHLRHTLAAADTGKTASSP
ncbi:MAG: lytic murein transglycosylase [Thiobacillus sp.]|nr:lytic murein transglycosylase [Thiobacillus sp.]